VAVRENGSYGGQERASRYGPVILSEWGSRGGKAVLAKYGPDYFKELRKRRKHYPNYSESPVMQPNRRVLAARENGRRGGIRRAEFYSPEHLREWLVWVASQPECAMVCTRWNQIRLCVEQCNFISSPRIASSDRTF
jgi:hypothetical protein